MGPPARGLKQGSSLARLAPPCRVETWPRREPWVALPGELCRCPSPRSREGLSQGEGHSGHGDSSRQEPMQPHICSNVLSPGRRHQVAGGAVTTCAETLGSHWDPARGLRGGAVARSSSGRPGEGPAGPDVSSGQETRPLAKQGPQRLRAARCKSHTPLPGCALTFSVPTSHVGRG